MDNKKEYEIVDELANLLLDTITLSQAPEIPDRFSSIDSLRTIHADLISIRDFLYAASNGDLSVNIPFKGFIAGTLKTIQANLRHMSWQTKMVASGDFSQRVNFMGEFSESFNAMVVQLDQTLKELMAKKENLLKEIALRKETEAALRKSEDDYRRLAITDPLTGLYNRRHFNELAEHEFSRALRYSRSLSIMMLDIDFFKKVNDSYGHQSGDEVLKTFSGIVTETLRAGDIVARYGGEEFIVLLPETTVQDAALIAERLREKIAETVIDVDKFSIRITASFGVGECVGDKNDLPIETLMSKCFSRADQVLYESKNRGRNRVTIF